MVLVLVWIQSAPFTYKLEASQLFPLTHAIYIGMKSEMYKNRKQKYCCSPDWTREVSLNYTPYYLTKSLPSFKTLERIPFSVFLNLDFPKRIGMCESNLLQFSIEYEAYNTCSLMDEGLNFISKPLKLCISFEHLGLCHIGCKHWQVCCHLPQISFWGFWRWSWNEWSGIFHKKIPPFSVIKYPLLLGEAQGWKRFSW